MKARRTATFNGVPITFSSRQRLLFDILRFIARRRPHLIRKSTLMGTGGPWKGKRLADETINSAIGRLRDVLRTKMRLSLARAIHTDAVDGEIAVRFEWPPKSE
jgi:DNA-binding winged helix-turn-helix (wHTH) protein